MDPAQARHGLVVEEAAERARDEHVGLRVQSPLRRCPAAPELFGEDEEGYGQALDGGVVPPGGADAARLAAVNCPERAINVLEAMT